MYQPVLNRFLSRDPLPPDGQPDILYDNNWFGASLTRMRNLYGYVGNDPVNYVDPNGLDRCRSIGKVAIVPKPGGKIKIGGNVDVNGNFLEQGDCKCKCCEMELWVRGYVELIRSKPPPPKVSRVPPHDLIGSPGKKIDPKLFQQDSPTLNGPGCKWKRTDNPGFTLPKLAWDAFKAIPNAEVEMHYDFELRVIDNCAKPKETVSVYDYTYRITGPAVAPTIVTDLAPCAGVAPVPAPVKPGK
jgi:RHS repeat-associated protein